jgi:flagellar hook assembly protein FlgD
MKNVCLVLLAAVLFLQCNTAQPSKGQVTSFCETPIDRACTKDTCGFVNIYNKDTVLIAECEGTFASGKFMVSWDGKDNNGNEAGCGLYISKTTIIIHGVSKTLCNNVGVTGGNSVHASGRKACDSLKNGCSGNYFEMQEIAFSGSGAIVDDTGCICCK